MLRHCVLTLLANDSIFSLIFRQYANGVSGVRVLPRTLPMNCNTVQIAGTSGLAYLESATRFLEQGDLVSARFLVEEGIRLAGNISGLDVGDKLQDLFAFICLKERIGKSDAI